MKPIIYSNMCGKFSNTKCVVENLVISVGHFVPWDVLSRGTFFAGTFCPVGRFVCAPWYHAALISIHQF